MEEDVIRSMINWPNVPAVYGWLRLDGQGHWRLQGRRIKNLKSIGFINKNYHHDARGCWFFQNGAQRVFVDLDYTPYVIKADREGGLYTQTGMVIESIDEIWCDEEARIIINTPCGVGLLDDFSMVALMNCFLDADGHIIEEEQLLAFLEAQAGDSEASTKDTLWFKWRKDLESLPLKHIESIEVPSQFGFVARPRG